MLGTAVVIGSLKRPKEAIFRKLGHRAWMAVIVAAVEATVRFESLKSTERRAVPGEMHEGMRGMNSAAADNKYRGLILETRGHWRPSIGKAQTRVEATHVDRPRGQEFASFGRIFKNESSLAMSADI